MTITLKRLLPTSQGRCFSNRYQMRRFKFADDMHKFLATGSNSLDWWPCEKDMPSGVYSSQVGYDREAGKPFITYSKV